MQELKPILERLLFGANALLTVTCWPKSIRQLEECAKQCLSAELNAKGIITPIYWDTTPLALNLKLAYHGFPDCPKWAEGGALLTKNLPALNKDKPILPGDDCV